MSVPKWTDERTKALTNFVGDETPVSQETVAEAAESLETSTRSVSSKLRKLGFDVELASAPASKFTDEQAATLAAFVKDNSGQYTYVEIAEAFEGGKFNAKSIQGKVLSLELTEHVKPAPKKEVVRTYTPDEENKFVELVKKGAFVEEIASALNKTVQSVRGKALSLLRAEQITAVPKQKETKSAAKTDAFEGISFPTDLTVEEIAAKIDKTVRGVKTMLTRRGLVAADYDGASKKAKAAEANS